MKNIFYNDSRLKRLHIIFGITSIFALVMPMILFKHFYFDWINHLWQVEYYTEYFRRNGEFPVIINSAGRVGCTYPLYYGQIFYEILALVTLVTGSARWTFIIISIVIYIAIYEVFTHLFYWGEKYFGIAHAITIIVMFAPYTITNLYNRNAITEFYAVWFLYLGIGTWLLAIMESDIIKSLLLWTVCSLSIIMMINTHPITAQVGGVVFSFMVLLTSRKLIQKIKMKHKILAIGIGEMILMFLACSAWLYIVMIGGVKTLEVGAAASLKVIGNDFSETSYLTRLIPFPFDFRTLTKATENVSTPYLDMQINVPLAVLYGVSLFILLVDRGVAGKKKVISLSLLMLPLMWLVFSSSTRLNVVTNILFPHVQFAYRLITYIDLFMAIGLLYNLMVIYSEPGIKRIGWLKIATIISVTLACHNIAIQWTHIYAIHDNVLEKISADYYPSTFMMNGYVDHRYPVLSEEEIVNSVNASFGVDEKLNPGHITISVEEKTVVVTDVQTSIYNKISVNGKEIDVLYFAGNGVFAFYLDPGVYELEYYCALPFTYLILRKIGQYSMLILAVLCCGLYIITTKKGLMRKSKIK